MRKKKKKEEVNPLRKGERREVPRYPVRRRSVDQPISRIHRDAAAGFEAMQWVGMLAPAKTPKNVIAKLNGALHEILAMPEVKTRFDAQGIAAVSTLPRAFQSMISTEIKQWKDVAKASGIKRH